MPKEKWNKQFQENKYIYGTKVNEFIKNKSELFPPNAKLACFAEGEGRNAVYLAKQGHDVTAYDISPVGLHHAKLLAEENGVTINTIEADLIDMSVERNKYDAAIMVFGHVHELNQEKFLNNMIQSVKNNGYFAFEVYSKYQINYDTGGPGIEEMLYNPVEILELIKPYKCIHFYYGEVNRKEGYRHTGVGHVIQVVIQK